MHRLTRIKQLAHTYLVYPSAVHTRFEHALGALFMADRMCSCFEIDGKRREIIRCAALLHDVGHGPFSHIFENIMVKMNNVEFTHEDVTCAIIKQDNKIRSILEGKEENDKKSFEDIFSDVVSLLEKSCLHPEVNPLDKSIISGTVDADKLDYLRRDSYHIGTAYGEFDLERLLSTLTYFKDYNKQQQVFFEKGTPVLESFKLARYSMYSQVYEHPARLVADRMFLRSLELALFKEKSIDQKLFRFSGNEKQFIDYYFTLDDNSIYDIVLNTEKTNLSYEIMTDLKNRRLFKRRRPTIDYANIEGDTRMKIEKLDTDSLEQKISEICDTSKDLIIVHKESNEGGLKSYRTFGRITQAGDTPLMYIDDKKKIRPYDDISPLIAKLEFSKKLYIFVHPIHLSDVSTACKRFLKL